VNNNHNEIKETWKPIVIQLLDGTIRDYTGHYNVSNLGRVQSLKYKAQRVLKPAQTRGGYLYVTLRKDEQYKSYDIHRLVAQAFIPNLDNKPFVNHLDENKHNNHADNLEWCTHQENDTYGSKNTMNRRQSSTLGVPVTQISTTGKVIRKFSSMIEAERQTGIHRTSISRNCYGKQKTAGGLLFTLSSNIEVIGDIVLCLIYFDCECDEDYIHPMTQKRCNKCGTYEVDQPNSHLSEVLEAGLPISEGETNAK